MIARPKTSRHAWETAGIGAFEVGNVAPVSRPDEDVDVPFELVLPQVALAAAVVGPHGELRLGDAGLAVHAVVEVARGDARVLVARQLEGCGQLLVRRGSAGYEPIAEQLLLERQDSRNVEPT